MVDERDNYFISYCSKNASIQEKTRELRDYFKREDMEYYLDIEHLKMADNFDEFIEKISICKNVVMFICDDYLKSWWCMKECVKVLQKQIKKNNIFIISELSVDNNLPSNEEKLITHYCNFWENERIDLIKNSNGRNTERKDETLKNIIKNIPIFIPLIIENHCGSSVEEFINTKNKMEENIPSEDCNTAQRKDSTNIETLEAIASRRLPETRRPAELRETFLKRFIEKFFRFGHFKK